MVRGRLMSLGKVDDDLDRRLEVDPEARPAVIAAPASMPPSLMPRNELHGEPSAGELADIETIRREHVSARRGGRRVPDRAAARRRLIRTVIRTIATRIAEALTRAEAQR